MLVVQRSGASMETSMVTRVRKCFLLLYLLFNQSYYIIIYTCVYVYGNKLTRHAYMLRHQIS